MTETVKTAGTVYEVGFHIVPAVSPENLNHEVEAIKAVLAKNNATIISEEHPKLRPLSYTMTKSIGQARHKYDTAYFGWIKFEAAPESAPEITKAFEASEKVLRFLLIKTVRENTLYGDKVLPKEEQSKPEVAVDAKKAPSAEELDKTIEKLVE